jgi:hypothetical protein
MEHTLYLNMNQTPYRQHHHLYLPLEAAVAHI